MIWRYQSLKADFCCGRKLIYYYIGCKGKGRF